MRISNKRVALGAGLASLALAAAPLVTSFGPVAHADCPNNSQNTVNPPTYIQGDSTNGGVYTSGGDPATNQNGYIGAAGPNPADNSWGYVEAGGDRSNPTGGYLATSNGGVDNGAPC